MDMPLRKKVEKSVKFRVLDKVTDKEFPCNTKVLDKVLVKLDLIECVTSQG